MGNTDLDPLAAMLHYKQLWTVEAIFRTAKHLLATRPIFHKLDENNRGHVFWVNLHVSSATLS